MKKVDRTMEMRVQEHVVEDQSNSKVKVSYLDDGPDTYFVVKVLSERYCVVYGPLEKGHYGETQLMGFSGFENWRAELKAKWADIRRTENGHAQ